jgi:hypothetical protein
VTAVTARSVRGAGLTMALICCAQFALQLDFSIVNVAGFILLAVLLVLIQLRPRGGARDPDVHRPSGGAVPAPALAECQLRKC